MYLSDLYDKKIITVGGRILGDVKEIVLNMDNGEVSHLLLTKIESIAKYGDVRGALTKNSVLYKRVKNVAETIIVSNS